MVEPLFLDSVMKEKIWGGNRIQKVFGLDIPSEHTGEYWGISAHPNGVSTIRNGRYQGYTLDVLYNQHPELFGFPNDEVFPLLTKILDASVWLSVQVHPNDDYSIEHEGELGKTECWYIIDAEEGAEIIFGHNASNKDELSNLIYDGNWEQLLNKIPVKAGDFFYVPSGTIHAIGPGVLILETQQSSDTTYRLYDFDRVDSDGNARKLHIKKSIEVTKIGAPIGYKQHYKKIGNLAINTFVSNEFFTVEKWELGGETNLEKKDTYQLFTILNGSGILTVDDIEYPVVKGENFILPSDVLSWKMNGHLTLITSMI